MSKSVVQMTTKTVAQMSLQKFSILLKCPMAILTHQQQTAFENIVEKGEIAHYEQILIFPQCFLFNQIIVSPFVHIFDGGPVWLSGRVFGS